MKVVGLVDYHSSEATNGCISSIRRAVASEVTIVVVDNGGAFRPLDPSVIVLLPGRNTGFAGACNLLLDFARDHRASWLWLLNNDCTVRPDFVRVMEDLADGVGADVYTSITLLGNTDRIWFGGGVTSRFTFRQQHQFYGEHYRTPSRSHWFTQWASGANMFLPQRTLQTCQYFDEHLFLYLEELEWQRRQCFKVAVSAQPIVRHFPGTTTKRVDTNLEHFFSARNSWLLGQQLFLPLKLYFTLVWLFDYIVKPALKGDLLVARSGIAGWMARKRSGPEALAYCISPARDGN